MAPTPSLRVVKSFTFQGSARLFSNRYHFAGGTPADLAHWYALMDAVVAAEKAIFASDVQIVEAIGYSATSTIAVATQTYATNGTLTTSGNRTPGDTAVLQRYATAARTSKGHPVYLFNYYHGARSSTTVNVDTIDGSQKTAMDTYAAAWLTGFSDGTNTYTRAGPNGAAATAHLTHLLLTHRDFPR